jgi:predicted nucleotidyltransferase
MTTATAERCTNLGPLVPRRHDDLSQRIADDGLILRVLVGSGVHGTAIDGQDDQDEMGVCVEPRTAVLGLHPLKHYIFRTQPEGVRSGPGDLDLTVYSLRRYLKLALDGNPTILLPLYVPDEHVYHRHPVGDALRDAASWIVTRQAGRRFLGYMDSQRRAMLGERAGSNGAGRADIIARYGFDTKFAMHMVRLGVQGVELLETGRITLPIPEPHLSWLRELRRGERTMSEALDAVAGLEARLKVLLDTSPLAPTPPWIRADHWLVAQHERFWYRR